MAFAIIMNDICFENVCKTFGSLRAVDDLSLNIPPNCIYGFLGPNGAGKTTALRMLMNIIRPDSGKITINQKPHDTVEKSSLGYMPEERGLYRKMTTAKVLAYFGSIKGLSSTELKEKVPHWLDCVNLLDSAKKKVEELSRGMHQKLQFAVTLINEPDLLILDEPFSGLDPVNLDLLKDIILRIKDQGKTIIFSTHVMHEAENLCDFILLINKGRTVINGTLDQIRQSETSNKVVVRLQGDTSFIASLPFVTDFEQSNRHAEITLAENTDHQVLLQALIQRCRVESFEVKQPSLHEIFVKLVGEENEKDS